MAGEPSDRDKVRAEAENSGHNARRIRTGASRRMLAGRDQAPCDRKTRHHRRCHGEPRKPGHAEVRKRKPDGRPVQTHATQAGSKCQRQADAGHATRRKPTYCTPRHREPTQREAGRHLLARTRECDSAGPASRRSRRLLRLNLRLHRLRCLDRRLEPLGILTPEVLRLRWDRRPSIAGTRARRLPVLAVRVGRGRANRHQFLARSEPVAWKLDDVVPARAYLVFFVLHGDLQTFLAGRGGPILLRRYYTRVGSVRLN